MPTFNVETWFRRRVGAYMLRLLHGCLVRSMSRWATTIGAILIALFACVKLGTGVGIGSGRHFHCQCQCTSSRHTIVMIAICRLKRLQICSSGWRSCSSKQAAKESAISLVGFIFPAPRPTHPDTLSHGLPMSPWHRLPYPSSASIRNHRLTLTQL